MKPKPQHLALMAEAAVAGLNQTAPSAEDRAGVFEGLGAVLPKPESEAAKYAATCIREAARAQQNFLNTLETRKAQS